MNIPQPPRPGNGGPPRVGGAPGSSGMQPGISPGAGPVAPRPRQGNAVSSRTVLLMFVALLLTSVGSLLMTVMSWGHGTPTVPMWLGFFGGLLGCTLGFGTLQFFVNQQYAAGTFVDWSIPIPRMSVARVFTFMGWLAGGVDCYFLAHHFARSIA